MPISATSSASSPKQVKSVAPSRQGRYSGSSSSCIPLTVMMPVGKARSSSARIADVAARDASGRVRTMSVPEANDPAGMFDSGR